MKVLVMGAGALGGYYGARLQAAGHEVTYIARGAHLAAMQDKGLFVESDLGDMRVGQVRALDAVPREETFDVVLVMVKAVDLEAASAAIAPAVGSETLIVCCQNGVRAPDVLGAAFGADKVAPMAVYMPAYIAAPGHIRHPAGFDRLVIGALETASAMSVARFAEALSAAGPSVEVVDDIRARLWEKLVLVASSSALTCLTRLDMGPIRAMPETRALLEAAIDEAFAVAEVAAGLGAAARAQAREFLLEKMPGDTHASMLDDLRAGKPLELLFLSGEVVRTGRAHGIETPVHKMALAVLMPYLEGGPQG